MPTVVPVFTLLLLAPGVAGATTGALAGAAIGGTLGLLLLVSVVVISLKYYRWRRSQFLGYCGAYVNSSMCVTRQVVLRPTSARQSPWRAKPVGAR